MILKEKIIMVVWFIYMAAGCSYVIWARAQIAVGRIIIEALRQ